MADNYVSDAQARHDATGVMYDALMVYVNAHEDPPVPLPPFADVQPAMQLSITDVLSRIVPSLVHVAMLTASEDSRG